MAEGMRCIVTGRVQGVSYRAATQRKARRLGLTGWVRNLADGSVELYAYGEPEALAALREWLWIGPPRARVAVVVCRDVAAADVSALCGGFEVR